MTHPATSRPVQTKEARLRAQIQREPLAIPPRLSLVQALRAAGRHDEAVNELRAAAEHIPNSPEILGSLALTLLDVSKLTDAEAAFRQLVALEPGDADAVSNHGVVLFRLGRPGEAEACFRRAIELRPDFTNALNNLGLTRRSAGADAEASECFRRVLATDPNHTDALSNLGALLSARGEAAEAVELLQRAAAQAPNAPEVHNNLGMAFSLLNRDAEAISHFERAIALRPHHAEAHSNLGSALRKEGQFDRSIAVLEQAIALRPGYPEALVNLGLTLRETGAFDRALRCYEEAIAGQPELVTAHWNLSLLRLLRGEWTSGWKDYEWRFRRERGDRLRPYPQPRFTLTAQKGSTVLVYAEQGFGDTIQFARYVPLLRARGYQVIFEVQRGVLRLLGGIPGVTTVAKGTKLPPFDSFSPLLSLPAIFGTTVDRIPGGKRPYLRAAESMTAEWRQRVRGTDPRPAIGLAWRGNPKHQNDRNRSLTAEQVAPLLANPDLRFVCLQKDARADELAVLRRRGELIDPTAAFSDFGETAAAISALDLVISVDSAVAHLAGGLGAPVWILLPFAPDWRWLLERTDSPWYASARLFRQRRARDWAGVLADVGAALQDLAIKGRGSPTSPTAPRG